MITIREEQAIARLHEFIEQFEVSCAEDVHKRSLINEECVDLVADLVEILKGERERVTEEHVIEYIKNHGYILDEVKDIVIKALEKKIPKKPIAHRDEYDFYYTCPTCNSIKIIGVFCDDCCQKIDWSDTD